MRAIEQLSDQQMDVPGAGGWSVKDNLAHLAAWERFMLLYHLQSHPPHEAMQVGEATMEQAGEDGLNAIIHERNRDRLPPKCSMTSGTHTREFWPPWSR
jgi:uncharacterized damage-inducible protein DinB